MSLYIKPDTEYHIVNDHFQLTNKDYELVIWSNGDKLYYLLDGLYHRENAPAILSKNGYQTWWIHNKLHNLNGPAIINEDGSKKYFIDDIEYEENKYWVIQKKCFKCFKVFNNLYELKVHLEQYDNAQFMIEYIYELLLG